MMRSYDAVCSISGGSDSDIVLDLIHKVDEDGKVKYSQCRVCADKAARQKRERLQANGALPQMLRGNGTYCYHCCKPICNGEKLCPECLERARKQAETAREYIDRDNHSWKGMMLEK